MSEACFDRRELFLFSLLGALLGYLFFYMSFLVFPTYFIDNSDLKIISEETATEICINLTNNSAAIGTTLDGKLICEVPSYDSTRNIIIKKIGEDFNG